ncbi:MAG: hypothetical protein K2X93_05075 [Candidatus Obscuribacterales bacterium]|nr:hypothetical protein [Candidatus Obscuribacterales bacterium]
MKHRIEYDCEHDTTMLKIKLPDNLDEGTAVQPVLLTKKDHHAMLVARVSRAEACGKLASDMVADRMFVPASTARTAT